MVSDQALIPPDEIIHFLKKKLLYKEVYQGILHQKIIDQTAQERGIIVESDEIQSEANQLRRQYRLEKAADTIAWLADKQISPEDWEAGMYDKLLTQKLKQSLFEQEVERFFVQNRLDFDRVLLYQIIVPYDQVAQELFYEIEESEISFYEAAHFYDIDESRRLRCGYEGFLYRWSLKPAIAAAVFAANPKEFIRPVQTEQGYHLLMVEEFAPAELTPEIHQEILDRLFQEWLALAISGESSANNL